MGIYIVIITLLFAVVRLTAGAIGCLDEDGNPVDSWVAFAQNFEYQYYWHSDADGFLKSVYDVNQTTSGCIMATVNQLYSPSLDLNNIAYALYNDDPPPPAGTASSTYAHSKGVLLLNDQQGFWLVHSKPNWPNARTVGAGGFPDTTYSQSLMCITLNTTTFDSIAEAQMVNYPFLYDSYISSNLAALLPSFDTWLDKGKSSEDSMTNVFSSKGGVSYTQFAKSKAWGKDLYEDLVAPGLNQSLSVETWRLGSGGRYLPTSPSSSCTYYPDMFPMLCVW
jgi:deoxyribonuclease II